MIYTLYISIKELYNLKFNKMITKKLNTVDIQSRSLDSFTNLFPQTKSIEIGLKPVGKTFENFHNNEYEKEIHLTSTLDDIVFDMKENIKEKLNWCLSNFPVSEEMRNLIEKLYKEFKNSKGKNTKSYNSLMDTLKKTFIYLFTNEVNNAYDGKFSQKNIVKDFLDKKYSKIKITRNSDIFQTWKKNIIFGNKEVSISHRIVKDNLPIFFKNLIDIHQYNKKIPELIEYLDALDYSNFIRYLSQDMIDEYNKMIGQINQKINFYKQNNKHKSVKFLKKLKNQILFRLGDDDIIKFENKDDIYDALKQSINNILIDVTMFENVNYDNILISEKCFENISKLIGKHYIISNAIEHSKNKQNVEFYSIKELNEIISLYMSYIEEKDVEFNLWDIIIVEINKRIDKYNENKNIILNKSENTQENIIDYYFSVVDLLRVLKYFNIEDIEKYDHNNDFHEKVFKLIDNLFLNNFYIQVTQYYSRTNKDVSKSKTTKLFWGYDEFGNGWVDSKQKNYGLVLLRKNETYYVLIPNIKNKIIFDEGFPKSDNNFYEKMSYDQIKENKVESELLDSILDSNKLSEKISDIISKIKNKNVLSEKEKNDFIGYAINFIMLEKNRFSNFTFKFKNPSEYNSIDEFIDYIKSCVYSIKWEEKIDSNYVDEMVAEGNFYLFEFNNKDLSKNKKNKNSTPNLFTKYIFEGIFNNSEKFKLNGGASIYYRPPIIKYSDKIKEQGHHYDELKNKFDYPIIKDKRYTEPHFDLKVSFKSNYRTKDINNKELNTLIQNKIKESSDFNIMGIDRGERNLLYVTIIDKNNTIIHNESLNIINGVDYHAKLSDLEKLRNSDRKNFNRVRKIKDLKRGYISHAIKRIVDLMIEYNAIIGMEDLNAGFKNSRSKIEKSVYQQFENSLISKLEFLVLKNRDNDDIGGLYKPYNLAKKLNNQKYRTKQNGVIFYVNPSHTSQIDPTTGFINGLNNVIYNAKLKILVAKETINKFNKIYYDESNNFLVFEIDYEKMTPDADNGPISLWKVCTTNEDRFYFNKENKKYVKIDVTKELKELFNKQNIDYLSGNDLINEISNSFSLKNFKVLYSLLKNVLTLRQKNETEDYILSPVKNKLGQFFDSRKSDGINFPTDSDSNGGFNIALKTKIYLDRMINDDFSDDKGKIQNITKSEWLNYIQTINNDELLELNNISV